MVTVLLIVALAQPAEVVDRTLAIVSGRTITLSDARTALALGLIEGTTINREVVQRLVDRELMLREADRYSPPEPTEEDLQAGVDAARAKAGGEAGLERTLAAGGLTIERLRAWIRNDRRIARYLQQRFATDERRQDLIADWVSDLRRRSQITIMDP